MTIAFYSCIPDSVQRWNVSIISWDHALSHGMDPLRNLGRILSAWATTSLYDHRSKAHFIEFLSIGRKSGLMWREKRTSSSAEGNETGFSSPCTRASAETLDPGGPAVPQFQRGMGICNSGWALGAEFSTARRDPHSI